jgi:hypothetical protein
MTPSFPLIDIAWDYADALIGGSLLYILKTVIP